MAGRFHIGGKGATEVCVTKKDGMIFSHAQSSATVSVTVHPEEGAPFTVHRSPFNVQSNPDTHTHTREFFYYVMDGCRGKTHVMDGGKRKRVCLWENEIGKWD
eukprot:363456-Chlamydomonas_euryale.AAC.6